METKANTNDIRFLLAQSDLHKMDPGLTDRIGFTQIGGGSSCTFPILLPGGWSMVGFVFATSVKALNVFKYMVATGTSDFELKEAMKDSSTVARVKNLLTAEDFQGDFAFDEEYGYLDLYTYIHTLRDGYTTALDKNSDQDQNVILKGTVSCCVSGSFSVRPVWRKKTGDGSTDSGTAYDYSSATQYYLERLDFGSDAQLSTWDGTKYSCDYDSSGSKRATPVVKSVYTSACPNDNGNE